jgi:hypothetical protein
VLKGITLHALRLEVLGVLPSRFQLSRYRFASILSTVPGSIVVDVSEGQYIRICDGTSRALTAKLSRRSVTAQKKPFEFE